MNSESHVIITFDIEFYRIILDRIRKRLAKAEIKSTEEIENNLNTLLDNFKKSFTKKQEEAKVFLNTTQKSNQENGLKNSNEVFKNNILVERNTICGLEGDRVLNIIKNLEPEKVEDFYRANYSYFKCVSSLKNNSSLI